jgi:hypothetical protein
MQQLPLTISSDGKPAERAVHVVLSRWVIVLLSVAILLPWLVFVSFLVSWAASKSSASAQAVPQDWTPSNKGTWGNMETIRFAIDLPDEYVFVPSVESLVRWSFPGYSKEQVLAKLQLVGVPDGDVKKLDTSAKWDTQGGVTSVEPGDPLVLGLAPEVRAKLYAVLVAFPQNEHVVDPIWFRPGMVDWRLQDSGLAKESIDLLKKLLYPQGNLLLFADFEPALRALPNEAERRRFMQVVSRKQTLLARVNLEHDTDVEKIAQYWGVGGRRKDLYPYLNALHRVEKGANSNIVCLLPEFARDRLYCHAYVAGDAQGVKQDCFWSAFNFFNDQPDNRFNDMSYVDSVLKRDYSAIAGPTQLGDLILVTVEGKSVIHAANYLADDIVFTKNGADFRQPWVLMRMADMIDTYAVKYPNAGTVVPKYFRKNGL